MRRAGLQASGLLQLLVQAACCVKHLDAGLPHLCGTMRRVDEHHKQMMQRPRTVLTLLVDATTETHGCSWMLVDAAAATNWPDVARLLRLAMSAVLCICVR